MTTISEDLNEIANGIRTVAVLVGLQHDLIVHGSPGCGGKVVPDEIDALTASLQAYLANLSVLADGLVPGE